MDLRWVVALTVLVTSEKLLPGAKIWRLAIAVGLIAAAAGLVLLGWKAA
jgi:type IV secretory pathway TrbD component